jgi:hypothetical protein
MHSATIQVAHHPIVHCIPRPIAFGARGYNTPANYPTAIFNNNLNSAFRSTEGEDYEIDYNFNMADIDDSLPGGVSPRGLLNIQPKVDTLAYPGVPPSPKAPALVAPLPIPRVIATIFAGYTLGSWSLGGQVHWSAA